MFNRHLLSNLFLLCTRDWTHSWGDGGELKETLSLPLFGSCLSVPEAPYLPHVQNLTPSFPTSFSLFPAAGNDTITHSITGVVLMFESILCTNHISSAVSFCKSLLTPLPLSRPLCHCSRSGFVICYMGSFENFLTSFSLTNLPPCNALHPDASGCGYKM